MFFININAVGEIEIKCKHCKKIQTINLEGNNGGERARKEERNN